MTDFTVAIEDESPMLSQEFKLKCHYRRALAYFDLNRYEDAIKDATWVLQHDVNNVQARSLLGRAFKIIHEYQKAEEQLNNAIAIESDQAALYTGIAINPLFVQSVKNVLLNEVSTITNRTRRYSLSHRSTQQDH